MVDDCSTGSSPAEEDVVRDGGRGRRGRKRQHRVPRDARERLDEHFVPSRLSGSFSLLFRFSLSFLFFWPPQRKKMEEAKKRLSAVNLPALIAKKRDGGELSAGELEAFVSV